MNVRLRMYEYCYSNLGAIYFASYFWLRNISQFHVHIFIRCFYCLVQLLPSLVFQLPLSLRFSRRSRHTNLVSVVILSSFQPVLFLFHFGFLLCIFSFFMCVCFQLIASKGAYLWMCGLRLQLLLTLQAIALSVITESRTTRTKSLSNISFVNVENPPFDDRRVSVIVLQNNTKLFSFPEIFA